MLYKFDEIKG